MTRINYFCLEAYAIYSNSPFLIPANYLYSDILPFNSTCKIVKYPPQVYSDKYDWLGPDTTRNS